ncbi:MAG: protein kinase [Planctomycetota bacterium]
MDAGTLRAELEALYERPHDEVDLSHFVTVHDVDDDGLLCELIEVDGRARIAMRKSVSLDRYTEAIANLERRPDPLDTAISVTLRAMSGGSRPDPAALDTLLRAYPHLEGPIREAAVLGQALVSTAGLQQQLHHDPRDLPCAFGPELVDGRPRYEMESLLGVGAFGQVYLAVDRHLSDDDHQALVAIKILSTRIREPWARQRMIEEATKARRIDHTNVVRVVDRGVSRDDEDYIVYEYVDGGDLAQWLDDHTSVIAPAEAAALVAKIARGAQAAHYAGVVHCDLKPGNIMLTGDGEPKIADFGIAARLGEGIDHALYSDLIDDSRPLGNLAFIAPEQFRKEPGALSVAADIYALGGLLYLLVTRKLPNGASIKEITRTHDPETGRTTPPSMAGVDGVDQDLDAILQRAMSSRPEDRHASAGALADDLEAWIRHEPIAWMRPSLPRVVSLWVRRKPALAALGILLGVALVALEVTFREAQREENRRTVAEQKERIAQQERDAEEQQRKLAQMELEKNEAIQAAVKQRLSQTLGVIVANIREGQRVDTEIMSGVWLLEESIGVDLLESVPAYKELRTQRLEMFEQGIAEARENGDGDALFTLIRESQLALWYAFENDTDRATTLITENRARWAERLDADDPWLRVLECVDHAVDANRVIAGTDEVSALGTAEQLDADRAWLGDHHPGSPVHALVLTRLQTLLGPEHLDRSDWFTTVNDELASHFGSLAN